MTKQDFIQYLLQPEKLDIHSISNLEKLVFEYPYFQIGRMLYLKNLQNENNIDYEKNVHITTAYAPNGKILYNLIKKKTNFKGSLEKPIQVLEEVISQRPKIDAAVGRIANKLAAEASREAITENGTTPKIEQVAILPEIIIINDTKKDEFAKKEVKQGALDEFEVFEKQMLMEAYRTSMTVDFLKEIAPPIKGKTETGKDLIKQDHFFSIDDSYSFGDWLKVIGEKKSSFSRLPNNTSQEISAIKKTKNEILNNYILEEAAKTTTKPKAIFYSAEGMAKKSLQDDENFVSETLAKIYLKQGNLPKAKRVYEVLLVKYPEKVHIFAPLLEKIKELIKQQSISRPSRGEGGK
jgi:hypothetical protein